MLPPLPPQQPRHRSDLDLQARAQHALGRITSHAAIMSEPRYWHTTSHPPPPQDEKTLASTPSAMLARANPQPYQDPPPSSPPPPSSSSKWKKTNNRGQKQRHESITPQHQHSQPNHQQQPNLPIEPGFTPPFIRGQLVLLKGGPLKWSTQTVFTVQDVYTRHIASMRKVPWTPQCVYPVVELRQGGCAGGRCGSGGDCLVVPLSRIVAVPAFLEKARWRRRVFRYLVRRDERGRRVGRKVRRYVNRFVGVWAEEEREGEKVGFVEDGREVEVYCLVEWVGGKEGEVERVKARDLEVGERERWREDMAKVRRLLGKSVVRDDGDEEGDGEGTDGESDSDDDETESLDTEEEYKDVLREFGLE